MKLRSWELKPFYDMGLEMLFCFEKLCRRIRRYRGIEHVRHIVKSSGLGLRAK